MENAQNMTNNGTANQQEIVLNFTFNVTETNLIISALRELPHRVSDELLRKVISQAQAQTQQGQPQPSGYQQPPAAFYNGGGKTTQ